MKRVLACIILFLSTATYSLAHTLPSKPTGYVNDFAGFIPLDVKQNLENQLSQFSASTSNEVALVVVPDLDGQTIEYYANNLFEKWKIGTSKNDNGVLLLIALQEKKIRIEVGYGLEGALPDITAKHIIDTKISPAFKQGDYSLGLVQGVQAIVEATQGEYVTTERVSKSFDLNTLEFILIAGFFLLQFLSSIFARSKSWWAGGIMGGVIGALVTFFGVFGVTLLFGSIITAVLILLGLLFDYIVSNAYTSSVSRGSGIPWWAGGGSGRSSGGSFGGFSGGSSGGGGASGSW